MSEQATLAPPQAKKYLFQVLAGQHWESGEVADDTGRTVKRDIKYGPNCPAGDLVETDVELDKRFNRPNSQKFRRMGEGAQRDTKDVELNAERQRAALASAGLRKALEKMQRAELVGWAEEQEIDLSGAVKRDDVLKILLDAVG